MKVDNGLRLERDGERADLHSLEEINAVLAQIGARIWAQDWSGLSDDLRNFLADSDPSPKRIAEVKAQFLLPRGRLLESLPRQGVSRMCLEAEN